MQPGLPEESFDVLIVGGGNAGLSVAARLLRRGVSNVAVLEPLSIHTYRPLLSYVGGGQAALSSAERSQESVNPPGCTWLQDSAAAVEADVRCVRGVSGRTYRYDDLVLAPGLVPDEAELAGVFEALDSPAVASNYLNHADKTWELVQAMPERGHAVFTIPRAPVSCTGTTLKPLFLAAAHWRRTGLLPGVDITLVIDRPHVLGVPRLDDRLRHCLGQLDVRVLYDAAVTELHPDDRKISISLRGGGSEMLSYDMLHLVPPFRAPAWVEASRLAADDAHGVVDVDPRTLRHRAQSRVWALGDAAHLETDPSGGAIRKQSQVLVDNLLAARAGGGLKEYDGYTVAPVATDAHRLVFGEFDRSGAEASSLPSFIDPSTPRFSAWAFDRYALPQMYWHLILKGRW